MIGARVIRPSANASPGFVWAVSGTATPDQVDSPFGNRRFPPYIIVTGYDYDMHRAIDIKATRGQTLYAAMSGVVQRATNTYFGWETTRQLDVYWTEDGASAAFAQVAPSTLQITGSRIGAETFADASRLLPNITNMLVDPSTSRWETRAWFTNAVMTPVTGGVFWFGIYDPLTDERAIMEYDGTTLTVNVVGSGGPMSENGTSAAVAVKFLDIYFNELGNVLFRYSNDPLQATWTTLATQTGWAAALTNKNRQCWIASCGWRSTDTNATPQVIDVDFFGFWDRNGVPKFGNTIQIANANGAIEQKIMELHNQELLVFVGDIVEAGQPVALAGDTGMDEYSGINLDVHCHLEYAPTNDFFYSDYQGWNPLNILPDFRNGLLPRVGPTNCSITVTDTPDPLGNPAWKLEWTLARNDQAFDLNEVVFTGTTGNRTRNYNTSVGEDPVNYRTPYYDGMTSYADPFDETSPTLVAGIYFRKTAVGDPVTIDVRDCNGNTIASYP